MLPAVAGAQALAGYSAEGARAEREWENKFRALPSPENQREYMRRLSAHPHHVGSPYDKENAAWLLEKMREWGLDAHMENFDVLFPTPKERLVELVEPTRFRAALEEPSVPGDPTSSQQAEQLPPYNAYSADGDVTAPLVYVNYGVPEDYEKLERMGISVKGAIVIARYGGSWRGIKPKMAAEHGAVGCILYSDPRDDGYFNGDVFPEGPMRNRNGAQRGSVMDIPIRPGDPLAPAEGAPPGATRLDLQAAATLTKIPVLPISYGDAQPLLSALRGPLAPEAWRGALALTYHLGPGPARVHLVVKSNWDTRRLYDIIARIPGSTYPDEWIVRGNHHDAWVNGAKDPVSGTVAELEEARALGEMLKQGWKPKRTIFYCVWDGEEPGLLGSTAWGETHATELRQHAAVYLNSDSNGRGFLEANGSATLARFVDAVAQEIEDPEKNISVWQRVRAHDIVEAKSEEERQQIRQGSGLRVAALGSGSDYAVFLDHLGIASLNLGYGGEDPGGTYHSAYDDFYWYTHFADTGFRYGRALSQTVGTAVMRLADADLLPYDFTSLAAAVRQYADELQKLLEAEREQIVEQNRELEEGDLAASADPDQALVLPARQEAPPHLNFAPLLNASDALTRSAEHFEKALRARMKDGSLELGAVSLPSLNAKLIQSERKLARTEGLPGRPWYKHAIYAPGLHTGYGVKTIPGVREAIEQKQWKEAERQVVIAGVVLQDEAALIDSAASELEAVK
jgi:N-acetylated-alpha-linked acidic dipeptidase